MAWKDPEKKRQYHREYNRRAYQAKAEVREKQREYRLKNLDKYAEYQRNQRSRRPKETIFCSAKSRAKKLGVPFNITMDDISWPTHCPIFGVELDYNKTPAGKRGIRKNVPSLDRRTNALGYVPGNVFIISHHANRLKSDSTIEQLQALIEYMSPPVST